MSLICPLPPTAPTSIRVLAVDDEPSVLRVVRASLEREGFEVAAVDSAERALEWISHNGLPHVAVVDLRLPGMDGLELCRKVLEHSDLPIIILSGVDDEATIIEAIEQVAEDYVRKPFLPKELAVRVKRVMLRIGDFSYTFGPQTVISDHLTIDFARKHASVGGAEVVLTPIETKLLHVLVSAAPRTITTRYLLNRVWPLEELNEDSVRVYIHRLRRKIEPEPRRPRYILTRRGRGYSFTGKEA